MAPCNFSYFTSSARNPRFRTIARPKLSTGLERFRICSFSLSITHCNNEQLGQWRTIHGFCFKIFIHNFIHLHSEVNSVGSMLKQKRRHYSNKYLYFLLLSLFSFFLARNWYITELGLRQKTKSSSFDCRAIGQHIERFIVINYYQLNKIFSFNHCFCPKILWLHCQLSFAMSKFSIKTQISHASLYYAYKKTSLNKEFGKIQFVHFA